VELETGHHVHFAAESLSPVLPVTVKRTFLHIRTGSSLRSLPSSGPRVASATDPHGRHGGNPRHVVKAQLSEPEPEDVKFVL
jgi:hypothetical protein